MCARAGQELLFEGVPLDDSWSIDDLPDSCKTLFLELKPESEMLTEEKTGETIGK